MTAQRTIDFDAPIARKSDPATSKAAAASIAPKLPTLRDQLYAYIKAYPGVTGAEIGAISESLRKRLKELERDGLIVPCGARRSTVSNHQGIAWRVV
jgi:hypothetical protein